MSCEQLKIEEMESRQIEAQVDNIGSFDSKTVFGFLGDFGIGNGMAKQEARDALKERDQSIKLAMQQNNCI